MKRTSTRRGQQGITARIPRHMRARIEEAAAWRGVSVSSFLVEAAAKEAEQVIEKERLFQVTREDAELIASLLLHLKQVLVQTLNDRGIKRLAPYAIDGHIAVTPAAQPRIHLAIVSRLGPFGQPNDYGRVLHALARTAVQRAGCAS